VKISRKRVRIEDEVAFNAKAEVLRGNFWYEMMLGDVSSGG
jgi:hypothetical protein